MTHYTQLLDKLGGADNFRAWKYMISLSLEEDDLDKYISKEVLDPGVDEAKGIHNKNVVKAKRIIANSIKDNINPHVSSLKTPKEMFNALSTLFEGKNINRKMTLRNQVKNVKIQNSETMQSYFKRDTQIKEKLKVVEEKVEEGDIVMTTLNGLLRSWDSFIQGI